MKLKKIISILLVAGGFFILIAGIYFSINAASVPITIRIIFSTLMVLDSICYFLVAYGIKKKIKWIFLATIVLILINIIGFVFDDFGLVDGLAVLYNFVIIMLIILWRKNGERG